MSTSDFPQHSLFKSFLLHVLPGALTTVAFLALKLLLDGSGYPPLLAFLLAVLLVDLLAATLAPRQVGAALGRVVLWAVSRLAVVQLSYRVPAGNGIGVRGVVEAGYPHQHRLARVCQCPDTVHGSDDRTDNIANHVTPVREGDRDGQSAIRPLDSSMQRRWLC